MPCPPDGRRGHTERGKGKVIRMDAVIKYLGSKWGLADWITGFFLPHHSYLEPFFGSGAVLFNKPRSDIETVNDLDGRVVSLFEWIRKDPERLAHEIYYTPYSRQVYDHALATEPEDSLQKAVNFCIQLNMGHGFRANGEKVGWRNDIHGRERAYAALDWSRIPERIMDAAERLRGVQIESRPAAELIPRFNYPDVLVYADPPYMMETRHGKRYRCEMDTRDHEKLLDILLAHRGPVVLSGYDSRLYNGRLKDWHREERESRTQSGRRRQEVLWMNFEPEQQIRMEFGKGEGAAGWSR